VEAIQRKIAIFEALTDYSMALASVSAKEDIFSLAAGQLEQITNAVVVAVATYDEAASELTPRYTTLKGKARSKIEQRVGCRIESLRLKVSPEMSKHIAGVTVHTVGSFVAFASEFIPASVAEFIGKTLGIGWITTIGLQHQTAFIGMVIIAGRKGTLPFEACDLEAFAGVLANALGRWLAERSLRESETRWQFALEGTGDGVWDWNPQTDEVFLSRQWKTMLGYADSEIANSTEAWHDRLHPDDLARSFELREQHLRGETPIYENEHRLRCKDGTYKWISARGKVVEWAADGKPLRFIGIHTDVTERRKIEEELRSSHALLQGLFDNVTSGVAIYEVQNDGSKGRDYIIKYFNRMSLRIEGKTKEDVVGKSLFDLRPNIDKYGLISVFQRVWETGEPAHYPAKVYQDEKYVNWYENYVFKLPTGEIVAIYDDITERKQAEDALRKSEEMLRAFVTSSDDLIFLKDENFRHLIANPPLCAFLGLREALVLGKTDFEVMPEKGAQICRASDLQALASKGPVVKAELIGERVFEVVKFQVPFGAGRRGVGGIIRDITERKQAEVALQESNVRLEETLAELRKTQEQLVQQERLAAVGQLAAGIAHDFNNALAAITLYAQLILRTAALSPEAHKQMGVIVKQTDCAADLVQQILDFSRKSVLERQPLALTPFLKEVVKLLVRTLPENIFIDLACDSDVGMINADPARVQQALVNLALNARDAMPDGGNIRITISRVTGDEQINCVVCGPVTGGEWIQVAVMDNGCGIPPDVLPHIFEPFFTTRAPLGHGLGLSQVYGIVKQHDGHIDVVTRLGRGTTFKLYWPVLPVAQPMVEAVASDIVEGGGQTILVVEDNAATRIALMDVLEGLNYVVLGAADGQEALEILEEHRDTIRLVLSDWVMPNISGLELVRTMQMRQMPVKVVMLTGYPLSKLTQDADVKGIAGWIQKPFDLERLADVVARVLAGDA